MKLEIDELDIPVYQYWEQELNAVTNSTEYKRWVNRGKAIIDLYRDERTGANEHYGTEKIKLTKFNILWSNVQILIPSLYGRMPLPEAQRRNKDEDDVSRVASMVLERCLTYEVEQYSSFNSAMRSAVEDKLLPGRGVAWVRFDPNFEEEVDPKDALVQDGDQISDDIPVSHAGFESAPSDYVYWQDFLHAPARNWEEVWWVARRVYMTRGELKKRFDLDTLQLDSIPYDFEKTTTQRYNETDGNAKRNATNKKAQVWEIWDASNRRVYWVCKGCHFLLDEKDDPLELDCFFPCPKPLFATVTNDTMIPVPDFHQYKDQAREMDNLSTRITLLTSALRVAGVYNAEFSSIQSLLDATIDNRLYPVDSWAAMAEKGGLKGAVEFLPIEEIARVLNQLYASRDQVKQSIFEITGISDIVRGATKASETLGAQQLKANFGSLRLRQSQEEVARFASEILRIKAEIMCNFFRPETLFEMSGIENTPDAQFFPQALELLKGNVRGFRIQVSSDTLAQIDEQAEKQSRQEFLVSVGSFMQSALPAAQAFPQIGPLLGQMLLYAVRGFNVGVTIESVFEQTVAKMSEQNDIPPEIQQQVSQMQQQLQECTQENEQLKQDIQGDVMAATLKGQLENNKAQEEIRIKDIELQHDMQMDEVKTRHDMELSAMKAELDLQIKGRANE